MLDALKAELLKLRVRRAVVVMISGLAAISAAAPVIQALFGDAGVEIPADTAAMWEVQTFAAFLFAGLGAVLVGGEFRSRVLTTELLRGQPRTQLIAAKLLAFLGLGVIGALAIGIAMILGVLIASLVGTVDFAAGWFSEASDDWALGLARAAFAMTVGLVFGGACGMVTRSTGAAVGTALAYLVFIEPAAIAILELISDASPPGLFTSIDTLRGEAQGPEWSTSPGEAATALAVWLAALSLLQISLFTRRDLT